MLNNKNQHISLIQNVIVHLELEIIICFVKIKPSFIDLDTVTPYEEFHRKIVLASSTLHGIRRQLHLPAIIEHFELKASI